MPHRTFVWVPPICCGRIIVFLTGMSWRSFKAMTPGADGETLGHLGVGLRRHRLETTD
ncbi:hypothetical protein PITCH_A340004 [uncultured Desulfobacterium sp.]|uniref:Uncharacterized protein n=1 Tax=uncultured Desulfobacterium sp. TaxID=201089 RepID=A0A445MZJ6_9BACT|nr:hypothetical protein PITCH_A340004 [uncultured Desulfobacterium sp.]